MLKYVSKLSKDEITNILLKCSLRPITFKNKPAICITKNHILVTCIKTDSLFYKTILEWNSKQNDYGDLIISYLNKSDFENFVTLSINDFYIKILNQKKILSILNDNTLLNIKLNSQFLSIMTNKFEKTNFNNDLKKYNLSTV